MFRATEEGEKDATDDDQRGGWHRRHPGWRGLSFAIERVAGIETIVGCLILIGPTDLRPAMESLDVPVLIVYSGPDWSAEAAQEARRTWPDAQVEIIEDTDHTLFVDRPEAFNRLLERFLAGL